MADFQQRTETALRDVFTPTPREKREIEQIADQADRLRSTLRNRDAETLDITVDLIVAKMEERADGGPKWAWNNWVGTAESFGLVPAGYQIES